MSPPAPDFGYLYLLSENERGPYTRAQNSVDPRSDQRIDHGSQAHLQFFDIDVRNAI